MNARWWLVVGAAISVLCQDAVAQECPFKPWMSFRGVALQRLPDGTAYAYQTRSAEIDADGAPGAYCPGDKGLDWLANAGWPDKSWRDVLVPDPKNAKELLIAQSGPGKGCYVSMTGLRSAKGDPGDSARYVNALTVPYMVFPPGYGKLDGTGFTGDVAMMQSGDGKHTSPAIVADSGGPSDATLGEVSIALAKALGASSADPRGGAKDMVFPVTVVVFRQSFFNPKWPVSNDDIAKRATAKLEALGGWPAVKACKF